MGTDRPKGGMEEAGPCGTPLTPEGIAAFAGETYTPQFGPTERGWRHCHLKNLIADYGERLVAAAEKETAKRCIVGVDGLRVELDAKVAEEPPGPRRDCGTSRSLGYEIAANWIRKEFGLDD